MFVFMPDTRSNGYNRERAVQYAKRYGKEPNKRYRYFAGHHDGGGDCSNFISQCLKAGGAPMGYNSQSPWWYNRNNTDNVARHTWAISWTVAHSLYWCLKVRGKYNISGLKGQEIESIDQLEIGDLIQYENHKGVIYHSTIITDFTYEKGKRIPLITQHSFDAVNIVYRKPAAAKMHFMKISI